MAPDGKSFATCGVGGVRLWNTKTVLPQMDLHADDQHEFQSVAFSRDGRWLVASGLELVENAEDTCVAILWDLQTMRSRRLDQDLSSNAAESSVAAISADSRWLAVSHDAVVDLWKRNQDEWTRSPRQIEKPPRTICAITFAADPSMLTIVDSGSGVTMYDASTGEVVSQFAGDSDALFSVAESPDRSLFATGGELRFQFWDRTTGSQLALMPVHIWVNSFVFTHDGRTLAWGGGDGSVNFLRTF